jgi:putative transposase
VSAYVDQHRDRFGVEPICETLDVSASAYYQRKTGERSARLVEDERLLAVICQTHQDNYEAYGYRRCWKALLRAGEDVARCQVQRSEQAPPTPRWPLVLRVSERHRRRRGVRVEATH